jgi:hypothetical protein
MLEPLDIVTTQQVQPEMCLQLYRTGTQSVRRDGRLFVLGGGANETQAFVE